MTTPIVIISTGRTGTAFFSKLIGELYSETAAYHERGHSRLIQIFTHTYFSGIITEHMLIRAWKLFKEYEIKSCRKAYHVDANSFLYGLVAIAPYMYPNIKVVHIVRDPRTYVTSHLNYIRFSPTSLISNYLVPFWQPNPFLIGKIPWKKYFSFSRFERYAWIWDFKNSIMESIQGTDTPYLRIRFEDIFHQDYPEQTFNKITDFIGLPRKTNIREHFSQPINQAPKSNFFEWPEWTPLMCRQLQSLCGERMEKYGYGNEINWNQKLNTL